MSAPDPIRDIEAMRAQIAAQDAVNTASPVDWTAPRPNRYDIEVVQHDDVCIALFTCVVNGVDFTSKGASKRAPGERRNPQIGVLLALGRALLTTAAKMLTQANILVDLNSALCSTCKRTDGTHDPERHDAALRRRMYRQNRAKAV